MIATGKLVFSIIIMIENQLLHLATFLLLIP